jgi:predicted amidohydrolase YtcJ
MADIVFLNGQVVTADTQNRVAEAVAVSGNRIVAVGGDEEMRRHVHAGTRVIDLEGRSLLPGFIDAHLHITLYGTNKLGVDCKAAGIDSVDGLLEALKRQAERTPAGSWVRASGFDENRMKERRYPTRQELDEVSTEHPIFVMRTCAHHSVVNSRALALAGFDEHTPDPQGGRLDRDETGALTGLLVETAHMKMFETAAFSEEEYRRALRLASDDFVAAGITSVHDAGGYGPDNLRAMQKAVRSGDVKVRIYAMICALNESDAFVRRMMEAGVVTGLGDERFRIGPAKVFVDGASTAATMAMRQPYDNRPGDCGILYYNRDELHTILEKRMQKGSRLPLMHRGTGPLTCCSTVSRTRCANIRGATTATASSTPASPPPTWSSGWPVLASCRFPIPPFSTSTATVTSGASAIGSATCIPSATFSKAVSCRQGVQTAQ